MERSPGFEELSRKLDQLIERQEALQREMAELKRSLDATSETADQTVIEQPFITGSLPSAPEVIEEAFSKKPSITTPSGENLSQPDVNLSQPASKAQVKKEKTPLEEFIGTNLLNKIGIAVLVIGVGIGTEYAIDHDLISPLTRIFLGYITGLILIGLAIRMKPKYESFSAVLLSGGMAVMYLITYVAYDRYHFFPQLIAFALMVLFTAFTVFAALQYNMQVIAIIGLVGAYAVPFMLSNKSNNVTALFSYIAIINSGILVIGWKKYWKSLYYVAFAFTWLVFGFWYLDRYSVDAHLWLSLGFSTVFFSIFYATVLAYKIQHGESLTKADVWLVLANSFIYYGFGYVAISAHEHGAIFLGLFTLFNALLHFVVCLIIFKSNAQSRAVFLFAAGLVLVFITLAVPVQLDGNWVTIIWAAEAALLFWLGRTRGLAGYEKLSYPLIVLAAGSLMQDWSETYRYGSLYNQYLHPDTRTPFLNVILLTSLIVCAAFAWIVKLSYDKRYKPPFKEGHIADNTLTKGLPVLLVVLLYMSFHLEVSLYWQQRYESSRLPGLSYLGDTIFDEDVLKFERIWLLNYTAIFVLCLGAINLVKIKSNIVGLVVAAMATLTMFLFVTQGFVYASQLRLSYLHQTDATYYFRDQGHLMIRYVIVFFTGLLLWLNYTILKKPGYDPSLHKSERIFFHFVILAILSSELVSGLALGGIHESNKLALSILWGSYALGLIVYGLMKNLKYIRVSAIVLFGVTLIKLFFYDLSGMGAISITIVMMILGALMLFASFMYNKFNKRTDENK